MKALIIANGTIPGRPIIARLRREAEFILCADGGANHARTLGITPDLIIGDMDSITPSTKKHFHLVPMLPLSDQESTDLEKALSYCTGERIPEAAIIGATGDRPDHSIGALGCFRKFGGKIAIRMVDALGTLEQVHGRLRIATRKGAILSLIPLDRCTGVTTTNLHYPLSNDTLELGVREGTSNICTSEHVEVRVRKGTLLCYTFHNA